MDENRSLLALALVLTLSGCTTTEPAPGAERARRAPETARIAQSFQEMQANGPGLNVAERSALGLRVQRYLGRNGGRDS